MYAYELMLDGDIRRHAAMVIRVGVHRPEVGGPVEPLVLEQVAPEVPGEVALETSQVDLSRGLPVNGGHAPDDFEILGIDASIKVGDFLVQGAIGLGQYGQ